MSPKMAATAATNAVSMRSETLVLEGYQLLLLHVPTPGGPAGLQVANGLVV